MASLAAVRAWRDHIVAGVRQHSRAREDLSTGRLGMGGLVPRPPSSAKFQEEEREQGLTHVGLSRAASNGQGREEVEAAEEVQAALRVGSEG